MVEDTDVTVKVKWTPGNETGWKVLGRIDVRS